MLRLAGAGLAVGGMAGASSAAACLVRCWGGGVSLVLAALRGESLVVAVPGAVGTVLREASLVVLAHLETCIKVVGLSREVLFLEVD